MFEIRVLWQKYRNQKEVDKQSKFDLELIIVTIPKEPLKISFLVFGNLHLYVLIYIYLLQGVIIRMYLIYEIDSYFNGVGLRRGLPHKFVIKSSLHREHLS